MKLLRIDNSELRLSIDQQTNLYRSLEKIRTNKECSIIKFSHKKRLDVYDLIEMLNKFRELRDSDFLYLLEFNFDSVFPGTTKYRILSTYSIIEMPNHVATSYEYFITDNKEMIKTVSTDIILRSIHSS